MLAILVRGKFQLNNLAVFHSLSKIKIGWRKHLVAIIIRGTGGRTLDVQPPVHRIEPSTIRQTTMNPIVVRKKIDTMNRLDIAIDCAPPRPPKLDIGSGHVHYP